MYIVEVKFLNGIVKSFAGMFFDVWRDVHTFSREHDTLIVSFKVIAK